MINPEKKPEPTQAVGGFVGAVSFPVEAIAGVTCADDPPEVVSALLLTG